MSPLYESKEELYFSWWLDDLKKEGYVLDYKKNTVSHRLNSALKHEYVVPMKRVKDKVKIQTILSESFYTYDFDIKFDLSAIGIFTSVVGLGNKKIDTPFISTPLDLKKDHQRVRVEIKGDWDANNMTRLTILNIKSLYNVEGILVNLVKIPSLFKKTFVPTRFLFTDKTKKARKINFKTIDLKEYVESKTGSG